MLNIDDPKQTESTPALWRLGFRPFFLFGAAFAAMALLIWLFAWRRPDLFWTDILPLWWHPHELLFGFAMAIVAGFLLTAVQTWTGQPGMKGWALGITFACWLVARLLLLLPTSVPIWLPALFDALFLALTAAKMWQSTFKVRQWRNIAFGPLLLLAAAVNLLSYWALYNIDLVLASAIWQAMIWWVALMITLVGGRVIPFFTARRLEISKPEPIPALEWSALISIAILGLQALFGFLPQALELGLLVFAGIVHLARLMRWKPHLTWREPLLWSLHLSYLCMPVTLLVLAGFHNDPAASRQLIHLLTIGSLGGMCLAMIARVSLGHTGRNIYQGPNMAIAFALVFIAALVRGIFPLLWPAQFQMWQDLAGTAWFLAFGLFVWHYTGILSRPRTDGRPG